METQENHADNTPQEDINAPQETTDEREQEVAQLKSELAAMRDQWMRAVAEAENIRKRARKEVEDATRYGVTGFARDMVSVLENLMRASGSIPPDAKKDNELLGKLEEGVSLTQQELLNIFGRYGIRRIDPEGQKFDHNFHEAVVQVERADVEPGTVIQVVQAGYVIHDRLLRPAMVAVSKQPSAPPEAQKVDTLA